MKKILTIIGGIVVGVIALVAIIFAVVSLTSKKMVCKSEEGNITLMYNDKTIKGYTAKNITYDLDTQKQYAEKIGVEKYLDEFAGWFKNNTTGSCER